MRLKQYYKNTRTAYLNSNRVAGFKFQEVKSVILQGLFDIVILAETKSDAAFLTRSSISKASGCFAKTVRNRHGEGLLIYTRRELITLGVSNLECVNFETIALSFQTRKNGPIALLLGTYIDLSTYLNQYGNLNLIICYFVLDALLISISCWRFEL